MTDRKGLKVATPSGAASINIDKIRTWKGNGESARKGEREFAVPGVERAMFVCRLGSCEGKAVLIRKIYGRKNAFMCR